MKRQDSSRVSLRKNSAPPMPRRTFLRRSAGLAAGSTLAVPAVLGAAETQGTLRVAIAGVRGRGRNHAEAFAKLPSVEVAALCDVDSRVFGDVTRRVESIQKRAPDNLTDFRRALDDKSIDILVISTPDHWHAPATIWACQAGKDVYVEKPCSHNFQEARWMLRAARKHKRIVQHGTQSRSAQHARDAVEFVRSGKLGRVLQAKAVNCQRRANIGRKADSPVPAGVNYDLWLGPAADRPFNPNRFHYNWHWFWEYGTGDMGNDGVHQLDLARWGLGDPDFPRAVTSGGGKFFFDDDQETPDTQTCVFEYEDKTLVYEMRLWTPYGEHGMDNGNVFYGEEGMLTLHRARGWHVTWKNGERGPSSKPLNDRGTDHLRDFIESVLSRKLPVADIEKGFHSSALAHLGNIAHRVGRRIELDRDSLTLNDERAQALMGREYRKGFELRDPG